MKIIWSVMGLQVRGGEAVYVKDFMKPKELTNVRESGTFACFQRWKRTLKALRVVIFTLVF